MVPCEFVKPTDTTCKFEQVLLLSSPFNLKYGEPFKVQVAAQNGLGLSEKSASAKNKEVMTSTLLVLTSAPDAPINLS